MQVRLRDFLLIPNILSSTRIMLLPLPAYCVSTQNPDLRIYTAALIAYGIITDVLDGVLARKLNQCSDLGKLLDPISDKLTVGVMLIFLHIYADFPLWALILILSRETAVLILSLAFMSRQHLILPSNMIGKFTALTMAIMTFVYVLDYGLLKMPSLLLAAAMIGISAASYGIRFARHFRKSTIPA